jgi:Short C-terminal domain
MGYLVKAILGAALFVGGVALFNVKLVGLLETGTCASGNVPYEIAPGYECPSDTGTDILLMTAGIFGGLLGAGIFAFRGEPPWGSGKRRFGGLFGAGTFAWGFFFTATGATSLIASLTNESIQNSNGGELGGIIVGITFLVMGVPALLISLVGLIKGLGGRDERPSALGSTAIDSPGGSSAGWIPAFRRATIAGQGGPAAPPGWSSQETGRAVGEMGKIRKLERLQKLRESGALTDAEFEREKAKILSEP